MCVLVLLFTLLLVVLLVAWYRRKTVERVEFSRKEATSDVVLGQENASLKPKRPQGQETVESLQLQQNEAYDVCLYPDKHNVALRMTLNAAYGCVTTSDANVVNGEQSVATSNNTAQEPEVEYEEYHYYY